ncbi:TPA: anaerobic ribonucleoside-triphosphate reductase activating protein [Candidatus Gracilibacteria bacterium]|nr:anaerobic ribonucleoside-triphosphate reductase activating protein [Candidatus Gracilibacteria bacterium]
MQISAIKKSTLLDYPGKLATIIFTPGCNLRCGFCHNPEFVLPEEIEKIRHDFISEEIFFRFLKTRQGFLDGVVICGGEPTIHADLPQFCQKIKSLGFLVKLDTNGSNPEVLERLLEENLIDYIAMDVKHTLEQYREITGKDIDILRYEKSMELIKTKAPDYEFRTTVIKGVHSSEDIEKIGVLIGGAKKYCLQNYRGEHTLDPNFKGGSFTAQELAEFQNISEKYVEKCLIRK